MHLGNEALTPECAALTTAVAAAGLSAAAYFARRELASPGRLLAATAGGSLVFLAQMVNVPVLPYSSGHLVGGVLLAAALGPGLGALTMALVLALQVLLLGDGGVMALGANVINMALISAGLVALAKHWQSATLPSTRSYVQLGTVACVATLLAAGLIVIEVALFRANGPALPLAAFAREMLLSHLVIGAGEGLLTALILMVLAQQPSRRAAFAAATATILLAALPFASQLPDGYESAAQRSGCSTLLGAE